MLCYLQVKLVNYCYITFVLCCLYVKLRWLVHTLEMLMKLIFYDYSYKLNQPTYGTFQGSTVYTPHGSAFVACLLMC